MHHLNSIRPFLRATFLLLPTLGLLLTLPLFLPSPARAAENQSERIHLLTYRDHPGKSGTFQVTLPPSLASRYLPTAGNDIHSSHIELVMEGAEIYAVTSTQKEGPDGESILIFGRYDQPTTTTLRLQADNKAGETIKILVTLPELDTTQPELEGLWAQARIAEFSRLRSIGTLRSDQAAAMIEDLAFTYLDDELKAKEDVSATHHTRHRHERRHGNEATGPHDYIHSQIHLQGQAQYPKQVDQMFPLNTVNRCSFSGKWLLCS